MTNTEIIIEYKKIFGGKRFPRITEEELKKWWEENKSTPYFPHFYEILTKMQDLEPTFYAE